MRRTPRIKSVMTPFPFSIAPGATLEQAKVMMQEHDIRHLPVCDNHIVVGVLSERELRVALSLEAELRAVAGAANEVGELPARTVIEACTKNPLLVELDEYLDVVAAEMAGRRIGSAIVMRGDKLAGILTTTDVCRLLAELLRELSGGSDDEVA